MTGGVWLVTGVQAAGKSTVEDLDAQLAATPPIGLWLETLEQSPAHTVGEILRSESEAVVA